MSAKKKFEPIKQRGGWLYWDMQITMTRRQKDAGLCVVRVTGNRTGRVVVEKDEYPLPALLRAIVKLAEECRAPAGEVT